jgi:glycosyltransferase involved in cell wall biosynthesis
MGSKISIVMPNYCGGEYIGKAINSVFQQTYTNWELLVVDDCSTDDSWNTIMKWKSVCPQIYAFQTDKNSGSPAAPRNMAIGLATGDYIAFLDSDDYWEIDKLEKQVKYMNHSDCGLTYHDVKMVRNERFVIYWSTNNTPNQGHCFNQLYKRNFMPACSVMARTDVIDELDYYQDTSLKISHDWEMFLRIARKHKIGYIPQALGTLRLYVGSMASQTKLRRKESREVVRRWKGLVPRGLYHITLLQYYLVEIKDLLERRNK